MKQIVKNALVLTAITLISGLLLGLVYEVTKGPIAASKEKAKKEAVSWSVTSKAMNVIPAMVVNHQSLAV